MSMMAGELMHQNAQNYRLVNNWRDRLCCKICGEVDTDELIGCYHPIFYKIYTKIFGNPKNYFTSREITHAGVVVTFRAWIPHQRSCLLWTPSNKIFIQNKVLLDVTRNLKIENDSYDLKNLSS